jgi:hypothetical protein
VTAKRTTQVVTETVSQVSPALYATQVVVQVLSTNALKLQATQLVVEVLSSNDDLTSTQQPVMFIVT